MIKTHPRRAARTAGALFFSTLLLLISAGQATARDLSPDNDKADAREARAAATSQPTASGDPADAGASQRFVNIQFVLYRDVAVSSSESIAATNVSVKTSAASPAGPRARNPKPPPSVSTAPMTAGEKFKLFATKSFKPPGPYAMSAFSGMFNEILDKDHGRKSSTGDFFADSGTRMARSMAFRATANFFEKFAYASVFKQDPRYHRSDKTGAGARIGYAVSRLFVTQGDRGGSQFNVSFIAGGMTAAAISNVWERKERQTVAKSVRRWGVHMGLTAVSNIFREFLSGQ